jgi:hypothetical protein
VKEFELSTEKGKLRLFSADELFLKEVVSGTIRQTQNGTPQPQVSEESYRAAVLECQKILDEVGIPTAKGQHCDDPTCRSQLGHRLRNLRDLYLYQKRLLDALSHVKGDPDKVQDLLAGNRAH